MAFIQRPYHRIFINNQSPCRVSQVYTAPLSSFSEKQHQWYGGFTTLDETARTTQLLRYVSYSGETFWIQKSQFGSSGLVATSAYISGVPNALSLCAIARPTAPMPEIPAVAPKSPALHYRGRQPEKSSSTLWSAELHFCPIPIIRLMARSAVGTASKSGTMFTHTTCRSRHRDYRSLSAHRRRCPDWDRRSERLRLRG